MFRSIWQIMFAKISFPIENFFLSDPELQDNVAVSYMSHKEKYEEAIRKSTLVFRKIRDLQAQGRDGVGIYMALLGGMLGTSLLREGNPMSNYSYHKSR